ncbi:MAG: hypothetical protein IJA47_02710 [Oscillospiraceae bacterium]|nr:hypothetical protein [Oscillospiraceae bacterium]
MEKLYNISIDGKLDEAAWEKAKEFTGFRKMVSQGGEPAQMETYVKVLQDTDCVYFGFKCMEEDVANVLVANRERRVWDGDRIELFVSPSGSTYDYYQFIAQFGGRTFSMYYAEGGQIKPDPYAPDWEVKTYAGEDYWSVEMKLPLIAFYMNDNASMSDTWLMNVIRGRTKAGVPRCENSSVCALNSKFVEFDKFLEVCGFHKRPEEDDLRIVSAAVEITEKTEQGYCGIMEVKTMNPVDEIFTFTSNYGATAKLPLEKGVNVFTTACCFPKLGRDKLSLALTRQRDGKEFKRFYPVTVEYEPIKLQFTAPEYRCNFYPGQDYTKIAGTVIAKESVTLKLEGPGIETVEITPNADGSFCFETPNFEVGEAWLTATAGSEVKKQKIRRLAPTGRMMTWISGGNLIVNGEPRLARTLYSPGFRCSKVFMDRYWVENYHENREIKHSTGFASPRPVLKRVLKLPILEVFADGMPCDELLRYYDAIIEAHKDKDFAYYYLSDEPECSSVSPVYLRNVYEYIAERDPYHVIKIASRAANVYVECADWFETHPYINPQNLEDGRRIHGRPLKSLGNYVDDIAAMNRPDKCIGVIPQVYSYEGKSKFADYLTLDEFISSTWACMIHGGKTLRPYATGDMADRPVAEEGVRYLFSSFEALEQLVLHGKRTQLLRTEEAECVLYDKGDEQMFVLVNFQETEQTVTVDGLKGQWYNFRHAGMLEGNTFTLRPYETLIGTSAKKDAGLPSYEETDALINKLEAKRVAGCSKLVPIRHSIDVTGVAARHRLLDGVRDNLAGSVGSNGGFIELDLSKVKVSFNKVVVSGWNMAGRVTLQLKNGGEYAVPAIAEMKEEELSTTYILKDTVCPDGLLLEFAGGEKGDTIEIYELEVF